MPKLWNIKTLTRGQKLVVELEPRNYGTSLLVVDKRHHYQGHRIARILLKGPDVPKEIKEKDRVIIKGHAGTSVESQDHDYSGTYRVIRFSDIVAFIGDNLKVIL